MEEGEKILVMWLTSEGGKDSNTCGQVHWTGKTRRASASRAGSGSQPGAHPMSQGTDSFRAYLCELSIMLCNPTPSHLKI